MQYVQKIGDYQGIGSSVMTIGKFDGLHKGHQKLIDEVKRIAAGQDMQSIVFVFDMHMREQIITNSERRILLEKQVDYLVECQFVEAIQHMEAEEFVAEILIDRFKVKHLVVGDDFRFGYNRRGSVEFLKSYEKRGLFKVDVFAKEKYQGRDISSSYIKEVIPSGNMFLTNALLGYPYTVIETVVKGQQIGRQINVPTINLQPPAEKLLPKHGVYLCKTNVARQWYDGVCNIGIKPTIANNHEVNIEVHLFGYEQEAYGDQVVLRLLERVRGEQQFASLKELQIQIQDDIDNAKQYFSEAR